MKKTAKKKLVLAKETVRNLEKGGLEMVAGGLSANTDCTYTNCCSGINTCGACGGGKTTGSRLC